MIELSLVVISALLCTCLVLLVILLRAARRNNSGEGTDKIRQQLTDQENRMTETQRSESRNLREELGSQLGTNRKELAETTDKLRQTIQERMETFAQAQNKQSDRLGAALAENRTELSRLLLERLDKVEQAQTALAEKTSKSLLDMRDSLTLSVSTGMKEIQTKNDEKLELMRKTVDEKLHQTLENRLTQSFEVVTKQLLEVQKGLSEMQSLAQDVGGLKKALTNVKVRGMFGEVQLGALLEQFLAPDQYEENATVRPRGTERVEYVIKLPGTSDKERVLLPIDAKFPIEDYQRLEDAYEHGDKEAIDLARKALVARITSQAQDIKNKYINPPVTTNFALLFLPVEGLYAEALRAGSLFMDLQSKYKVTIVGPTTLAAFLNSLQVGFKTLAISKQSDEVWKLLSAVKTEFGKFGDAINSVQRNLEQATSNLAKVGDRSRLMERKLKSVEELPASQVAGLLGTVEEDVVEDE